jgi:hypothetical protein
MSLAGCVQRALKTRSGTLIARPRQDVLLYPSVVEGFQSGGIIPQDFLRKNSPLLSRPENWLQKQKSVSHLETDFQYILTLLLRADRTIDA